MEALLDALEQDGVPERVAPVSADPRQVAVGVPQRASRSGGQSLLHGDQLKDAREQLSRQHRVQLSNRSNTAVSMDKS